VEQRKTNACAWSKCCCSCCMCATSACSAPAQQPLQVDQRPSSHPPLTSTVDWTQQLTHTHLLLQVGGGKRDHTVHACSGKAFHIHVCTHACPPALLLLLPRPTRSRGCPCLP
jgi:hypothetical protein